MNITLSKAFALGFLALGLSFASCKKPGEVEELGSAGTTIFKAMNAGEKVLAFDPLSTPQTGILMDVRRDAVSSSDLNTEATAVVSLDQAYLDAYNEENETEYEYLPVDIYTTTPALSGDKFNLVFAPGEFAKQIKFSLTDATKIDFSKQYAFPLTITEVASGKTISASKTVLVKVLVKNAWDGAYEVTGTMQDDGAALGGLFPMEYNLITSGANTVDGFDPVYWGDYFVPIMNGADVSGYGSFSPVFTFDPATNKIVSVTNIYGQPAGNTRSAEIDPSGENFYDPATKTIKVKFFMKQPSVITTAPHIRVKFNWTMKRTGDR
ncbi:BT_3987 domain-containing protein [Flavihumibacter solisilvae]|uniref:BT-3987-like N-terminal domain-containing protein n=1 Tax=Flavihumibacter solisilvae TaxID=1349421 RepID=A0A0C1L0U3_9BACT|nr:DUF1735 domain-containing protein [Flavihumibacter solisilvae]KIC93221.1 hypothetical protein OI18_18375 [Flavihumibacter solisilvae]